MVCSASVAKARAELRRPCLKIIVSHNAKGTLFPFPERQWHHTGRWWLFALFMGLVFVSQCPEHGNMKAKQALCIVQEQVTVLVCSRLTII